VNADRGRERNNDKRWERENKEDKFHKGKQNKGGPSKKTINQVWNKVGFITTNKFDALNKKGTECLEKEQLENKEGNNISTKQLVEDTFSLPSRSGHQKKGNEEKGEPNLKRGMNMPEKDAINSETKSQEVGIKEVQMGVHIDLMEEMSKDCILLWVCN